MRVFVRGVLRGLTRRDRRALGTGAIVLGSTLLFAGVLRPAYHGWSGARDQLRVEQYLLARETALLHAARSFPSRFEIRAASLVAEAPRLFSGADTVAAAATLANYVVEQAIRHRVFVQGTEAGGSAAVRDGVHVLKIQLRAVSDLRGVVSLLEALEAGPKLVSVDAISIAPASRIAGMVPRDDEVLGISMTLSGYALAQGVTP